MEREAGGKADAFEFPSGIDFLDCREGLFEGGDGVGGVEVVNVDLVLELARFLTQLSTCTLETPSSFRLFSIPSRTFCLANLPALKPGALVLTANLSGAFSLPRISSLLT